MAHMKTIPVKNPICDPTEHRPAPGPRDKRRAAADRGLAECEAAQSEYLALRAELARIQGEMDEAANQHVEACTPIQAELKRIGDNCVSRVLAGQPAVDARDDKRRSELLADLSDANSKLDETLRRLKAAAQPIEQRATESGMRAVRRHDHLDVLLSTADPELRAASRVAERTASFAKSRLDAAAELNKQYPNELTWSLELTTAAMLYDQAMTESTAAFQAMLTSE